MSVHRYKNQGGKNALELPNQRDLCLRLGVEDIGHAQAHLETDHRSSELNGGKKDLPNHAQHQSNEQFPGNEQQILRGLIWMNDEGWREGLEDQGQHEGQHHAHLHRYRIAAEHRGGGNDATDAHQHQNEHQKLGRVVVEQVCHG